MKKQCEIQKLHFTAKPWVITEILEKVINLLIEKIKSKTCI